MLADLRDGKGLLSFAERVRQRTCAAGVRVFDRKAQMVFVKPAFKSGGFSLSLNDYDRALNVIRAWSVK